MPGEGGATEPQKEQRGSSARLDSWKEIATYLKRDPRTVRRWERQEGLPVHRHRHGKKATVYGLTHQIETWLVGRRVTEGAGQLSAGFAPQPSAGLLSERPQKDRSVRPLIVAVLPLRNLTGDLEQERFADGLTEELIMEIGQCCPKRLRVIALTSAMQYKQSPKGIAQIGRELGADYILEGGIHRTGQHVRLAARLIAARDQAHIWADSYEVLLPPIFALQQTLARELADSLYCELEVKPRQSRPPALAVSAAAHSAYIEGCSHYKPTDGEFKRRVEALSRAIRLDPAYAAAYAELTLAYFRVGFMGNIPPLSTFWRLEELSAKALTLDPGLAQAHVIKAFMDLFSAWRWPAAEASSRRAIELNPSYGWARIARAFYHLVVGDTQEAIEEAKLARQLDPRSTDLGIPCAFSAFLARRYELTVQWCLETLREDSSIPLAHLVLALGCAKRDDRTRALTHCEKARELGMLPVPYIATACSVYALAGQRDTAKRLYADLVAANGQEYMRYVFLAHASVSLGDNQRTLEWLEKAYEQRDPFLVLLKADPRFDPLSGHPRFRNLLRRIGLPR